MYGVSQNSEGSSGPIDIENVGQKAEKQIQEKYKVTDAIEEELDEYGEELEFDEDELEADNVEEEKNEI